MTAPINPEKIQKKEILPGFWGNFIHSENMTLAHWEIKKGSTLPEHSHHHEQALNLLEGEFELILEGETIKMTAPQILVIPSNSAHAGTAITDCIILDVFSPRREDYD